MKTSVNLEKKSLWSYYWEAVTSKYAAFNEGASRRQYWSFVLFYTLFNILITFFIVMGEAFSVNLIWLGAVYQVILFIPSIAILVRRLHDAGFSAWWLLTIFIPIIIIFLPTDEKSKYRDLKDEPLSKNKKIVLSIVVILFSLGVVFNSGSAEQDAKREELYLKIIDYQVKNSRQPNITDFNPSDFRMLYTDNCPVYLPFIYFSLNPKTEFYGVSEQQGEVLYTFNDGRYLNFGYYDPEAMGKDEPIQPIFRDHNDLSSKTTEEMAQAVSEAYCTPIDAALDKYEDLPVEQIVANLKQDLFLKKGVQQPTVKKENKPQEKRKLTKEEKIAQNIAQFEEACPECKNIYLLQNNVRCRLTMLMALSECENTVYERLSDNQIRISAMGCPGGKFELAFSYGTQFATIDWLISSGTTIVRNPFTAAELDASAFRMCWVSGGAVD